MDIAQIERFAMKGIAVNELPERLDIIELMAFLCLRSLYRDFQNGRIERDQARREKGEILDTYARGEIQRRCYVEDNRRRNTISAVLTQMAKSDCPRCRYVASVLDGRVKE